MIKDKYKFIVAAATSNDTLLLSVRDRALDAKDMSHAMIAACVGGGSGLIDVDIIKHDTQDIVFVKFPTPKILLTSSDGDVTTYAQGKCAEETVEPDPYDIRRLSEIEGYAYACGIDRQVYQRIADGKWRAMHAPDSSDMAGTHGFESISGFSKNDIYAAGWRGEIWRYDGKKWMQVDSPTNVFLSNVICAADGNVYVGGKGGIIIKGRGNDWTVINKDGYDGDIWGMQWFQGKLYTASLSCVCVLNGENLERVDVGVGQSISCYHLPAFGDATMWSVGTDDIFSFDGKKWTRIE